MGIPHRIGVIGLGVISGVYLDTLSRHPDIDIVAVADLDAARSAAIAAGLPGTVALSVDEILARTDITTILNLTTPLAHADVAVAAIAHGKDVFGEKPLAVTMEDARRIQRAATDAGRAVGSAPDTVLGTGIQTAREVIERGEIGRPVSATATWFAPGHELWHPQPDFYYQPGGGPMLDMGPYYITSLLHLLGPVTSVFGASSRTRETRTIETGPRAGVQIPVGIDTHVSGILEHAGGAISTITVSFDGVRTAAKPIEVHGERGSLLVPDPNLFDGDVHLQRRGEDDWAPVAPSAGYAHGMRGLGLLDFVWGVRRANGDLALHALEVMLGVLDSARSGTRSHIASTFAPPALVPFTPEEVWRGRRAERSD